MAASALLLSALSLGVAAAISRHPGAEASFEKYVSSFGRAYVKGSGEYTRRLALFQSRVQAIEAHNSKPNRLWTAGVNHLTDRTHDELSQLRGWRRGASSPKGQPSMALLSAEDQPAVEESVDWRHLSLNNSLTNQGGCGSCWAVATSVMLQARYEAKTGKSRTFSAQQLVNCVENPKECGGQGGCKGATVELAMDYIQNNPTGLADLKTEEYTGFDGACPKEQKYEGASTSSGSSFLSPARSHRNEANKAYEEFGLTTWEKLPDNKALPLMQAVADGPVAISVAADAWSSYSHGIFDSCSKDATIDHAVVLFGYGTDNGKPYWMIRNSWGPAWGEDGYIRLLRQGTPENEDKHCGTDYDPSVGVACKPYPKSSPVCGMCGMLFDSVVAHFKAKP